VTGPVATPPFGTGEGSGLRLDIMFRDQRLSLMRYFTRNRASEADAEDLAQEAFLRLANADQSAAEIAKPVAYLHQIGRNLMRDHVQGPARRHEFGSPEMVDEAVSEANELGRLEARDKLRRVEAALARLKPKTRNIFLAHRLDGMTYGEIAERTGLSVKGVEKQMSKAIAQLGRALDRNA
jgi:RNA polymerase sigma-70 factor (ECF subfamily)